MAVANGHKGRSRGYRSTGHKGLWFLAVAAMALITVMVLMMISSNQTPYGATQVWSAEPSRSAGWGSAPIFERSVIGAYALGQDTGTLPAVTLTQFGAR